MKKFLFYLIVILCAALIFGVYSASASDVVSVWHYKVEKDEDIPDTLYVGWFEELERYDISILQQPVLHKSTNGMVADEDTKYLTIRIALTNLTGRTLGWLAPDCFTLQEVYMNRIYGTYALDVSISAKTAQGFKEQAFFSPIPPHGVLYTSLVFEVFPGADAWILNFEPHSIGQEPLEDDWTSFLIPKPVEQN